MARDLTGDFITEIEANNLRPALLYKAEFAGGDVRAWTGTNDIVYNSETYLALGNLISVSPIKETQSLQANGVQISLSGVPSAILSIALNNTEYAWKPISIWFAVLDENYQIIADPYLIFKGKMDVLEINDNGQTSTLIINAENELIDLKKSKERRYTPEDQKKYFPDDKGLDFIPTNQDIEITWGFS